MTNQTNRIRQHNNEIDTELFDLKR